MPRTWCPATWSGSRPATGFQPISACSKTSGLRLDQAALTGESLPVGKDPDAG
jgi:hypothetical protein